MEEKDQSQVISIRVSAEVYEKVKAGAEAQGMSVGDMVRGWAEKFAAGGVVPVPPGSPPEPVPADEVGEMKRRIDELTQRDQELQRCISAQALRISEVQAVVTRMCHILWPGYPLPPWGSF